MTLRGQHTRWIKWIAIVAAASAAMLGIVCYRLHRDLARMQEKSDKFDDYCAYVRAEVVMVESNLRHPLEPDTRNPDRDKYVENYLNVHDFGKRSRVEIEWCAASPIDFDAIDARLHHCTAGTYTCVADVFAEVKSHLQRTFR